MVMVTVAVHRRRIHSHRARKLLKIDSYSRVEETKCMLCLSEEINNALDYADTLLNRSS
jgi:hypothetical protein